jgi:hypothetical protein
MTHIPTNAAGELAARLLYINQQQALLKKEADSIKEALEELYSNDGIARQTDADVLFSDGTCHKVRLQRKSTGQYFKVLPDFKDEFSTEKHKLEGRYLKAGKAEMADKACSWVAQEIRQ